MFGFQYESVDFHVEDCDSREEAEKEIQDWASEWITSKKEEFKVKCCDDHPNCSCVQPVTKTEELPF